MIDVPEQSGDRYCVFRSGSMWFAIPANAVREVSFRPRMVSVPGAPPVLAGMCHFRNEFLATLSLRPLTDGLEVSEKRESQIVVLNGEDSPWALLVDEVVSLAPLEPAVSTESPDEDGWSGLISGWATFGDHSVRVLEPQALYESAAEVIQSSWLSVGASSADGTNGEGNLRVGSEAKTGELTPAG